MWEIEPGWIIAAFSAMFTALTGVVSWVGIKLSARLDQCEKKHEAAHTEAIVLTKELATMQGKITVLETFSTPTLAAAVSSAVVKAIKEDRLSA